MSRLDDVVEEVRRLDHSESQSERLVRKLRETPFLGVGMMGLVGASIIGGYRFKNRPSTVSASQYLMQLRVAAQGMMVGSLALGVAFTLFRHHSPVQEEGGESEDREK